jgi:hypothetical protein
MTIIEHRPGAEDILDFVDDSIRQISESGARPGFIVVGPAAYGLVARAISVRFRRGAGVFEAYSNIPIVVDPSRSDQVVVLPCVPDAVDGMEFVSTS